MAAVPEKTDGPIKPGQVAGIADEKDGLKDMSGKEALIYEKEASIQEVPLPTYCDTEALSKENQGPLETAEEIVTHVIHVDDDPTLNPWTFRMFFIGEYMKNKYRVYIGYNLKNIR